MILPILVIDDSLTVRMNLTETLEAAGLAVVASDTGAGARRALQEKRFSLVILDVLLPDVDGIEILKEIRETPATQHLPVMLLSSEAEVRDRIRGLQTGADEYIGKPYDANYVVARARDLVRAAQLDIARNEAVLVIDDSATFREALKEALEGASYHVVVATSGEEGLRLAAQVKPIAILVDRMLPGIDGGAVIRRLRFDTVLRRVPCLLLTSSDDKETEVWALEAGADSFVRKEETIDVILAKFRAMLRSAESQIHDGATATLLTTKRILAVDDSETFLQELADVLRIEGYDVVLGRSGEEALELLSIQPVDCILLDVVMPGMGGLETCRRLKEAPATRDIPIMMLTAIEDRSTMIQGLNVGADDFVAKTSDFSVLRARLAAQLRRRQFEDENRVYRSRLQEKELEAAEARAAKELAEVRADLVRELEVKVDQRTADLRKSEERFRDIAETSSDWIWEADAQLRLSFVGGAQTDLKMGQIQGKTFRDLFGDGDEPAGWRRLEGALLKRQPFRDISLTVGDDNGLPMHVTISGKPIFDSNGGFLGYRGAASNRTAVVQALNRAQAAEAELRRALDRLNAAFDASPAAIVAIDPEHRVILWNRTAQNIYGWSEEEAVGRTFFMVPEDDRERIGTLFSRVLNGESVLDVEGVHLTKDDRKIDVILTGSPLRDQQGQPAGALYMISNVTDKKVTEEQLRQSQKMEAVGQLTGGVAHDFNNILMVIMSNVEELLEDEGLSANQREMLSTILTSSGRAADMTRRLLAFSRKQRLAPQPTNLNDLVVGLDKMLRRTLGEQVEIEAIFADDLWTTNVDRSQVEAALVNLCVNARDAMPNGGRLIIETENTELDEDYASANAEVTPGSYVLLAVSDTGTGMPRDILAKVFEPFFTTKELGKGTGLGLSMVYGFVKQSNGHIKIYSEVGHGTTIRLYLPRGEELAEETGRVAEAMSRGDERILLVEDQPDVRASILRQLRSLGYDVTDAENGRSALERLERDASFALLVTDVVMPGMDGFALAKIAKERWPEIKVLFMSGFTRNSKMADSGDDLPLLTKPFRKIDLARMVRAALFEKQELRI